MTSSSSSVVPTASCRRRSSSPTYSTGSTESGPITGSMRRMRRVHAPKSCRAASMSSIAALPRNAGPSRSTAMLSPGPTCPLATISDSANFTIPVSEPTTSRSPVVTV